MMTGVFQFERSTAVVNDCDIKSTRAPDAGSVCVKQKVRATRRAVVEKRKTQIRFTEMSMTSDTERAQHTNIN